LPMIITPDVGDISELVRSHSLGTLINLEDSFAAQKILQWAIKLKTERSHIAEKCARLGEEFFNFEKMNQAQGLINNILGKSIAKH
ncbi:MAG: hypothetical protein JWQ35_1949, partial [Bacteriovoracaceae bacterium]|nr:hypothetical protein [Bacteriovoracaceae bacterium]